MSSTMIRRRWPTASCFSCMAALVLLLPAILWLSAAGPEPPPKKLLSVHLNVGFSHRAFLGVNRNDAEIAFKACLATVGRDRGYDTATRCDVFETAAAFEAAIRKGELHLQIIPTWDYLKMDIQGFTVPYFVPLDEAGILEDYLLLTRRDGGITTLADLRGQSIASLESGNVYSSRPWVETMLLQGGLGRPEDFFGRVDTVSKASLAVLPVFFGKQQACVVDRSAFQVMKELNPQIGQRLRILTSSEPLLGAVFCLQKTGWDSAQQKHDTSEGLADLHNTPAGQQILTLFKVRKLMSFKPEYLESVKRLRAAHDRLTEAAKSGASTAVPPSDDGREAP